MKKRVAFKVFKKVAAGRPYRRGTFNAAYRRFTEHMYQIVRWQALEVDKKPPV